jgi:hypothetical protein
MSEAKEKQIFVSAGLLKWQDGKIVMKDESDKARDIILYGELKPIQIEEKQ